MRLARPSASGLWQQLGFIGPNPIDLEEKIRAVAEIRPQRREEMFAAGVISWGRQVLVGGVAARFSGVYVAAPYPNRQTLTVVTRVRNFGAGQVLVRVGAKPAWALEVLGGPLPIDNRVGVAEIFNAMFSSGDAAALSGTTLSALNPPPATGPVDQWDQGYVVQGLTNAESLLLFGAAANQAVNLMIEGYTFLPR